MRNLTLILTLALFAVGCAAIAAAPNGAWDAAWSTDGNTIAFTSGSPHGVPNIWIINTDKTGLKQMTFKGAHAPVWLPDGKTLAFGSLRHGDSVYMSITAADKPGSEKQIDYLPIKAENPVWSPDGSLVAYGTVTKDKSSRDLYFARTTGGGSTGLTMKFWVREWAWTPDGGTIAFVVGKSTGTSLWTIDVATRQMRLLYKGYCSAPAYSPDGKYLALAQPDPRSGFKLVIIDLAKGTDKRIGVQTFDGNKITWSKDGKRLFFASSRKSEPSVWSVGVDGKNITRITPKGTTYLAAAFSPDGKKIASSIVTDKCYSPELLICDTTGKTLATLTSGSSASYYAPIWSADGKQFAFQSDVNHTPELFVSSTDGRISKPLAPLYSTDPASITWLSDDKRLLAADAGRLLMVNPTAAKDMAKQLANLSSAIQGYTLYKDEIIVSEWGTRNAALAAVKLDGSNIRALTQIPTPVETPEKKPAPADAPKADNTVDNSASSPSKPGAGPETEGEVGNPHSGLDLMGPHANIEENTPPVIDLWPAVSPDGKTVAFVRNNQICIVGIDGKNEKLITKFASNGDSSKSVMNPCWSPAGDLIMFLAFNNEPGKMQLEIWTCGVTERTEHLVYSENVDTEYGVYYSSCTNPPVYMADGKNILFTSISTGEPRIVTIGLDGKDLRELVAAPSSFPSIDRSGKQLAYVDLSNNQEKIRVIDLGTGKTKGAVPKK